LRVLGDEDGFGGKPVADALKRIDPEAGAEAGIK
jgi:hypothetical protein